METLKIFLISFGLAMDAFSVSVASGSQIKSIKMHHAFKIAFCFGGFQLIMPIIGAFVAVGIKNYVEKFDHWLAFIILFIIGAKMIYESSFLAPEKIEKEKPPLKWQTLILLGVATSIDALAVGFTLPFIAGGIMNSSLIIGIVTFAFCFTGVIIGEKIGHILEDKIEIAGGIVLIIVGLKILLEHLMSS